MDMKTLQQKHREVDRWLSSLCVNQEIPQYGISEASITSLYELMLHNQEMDRLAHLCIQDLTQKIEEYKLKADRLRERLESVGLSVYVLSNAGKTSLKTLADLASVLQIKDVSKSTYCLAMADLSHQLDDVNTQIEQKEKDIEDLRKREKCAEECLKSVDDFYSRSDEYSSVDIPVLEKRKKDIHTLSMKTKTYNSQIDDFEKGEGRMIEEHKHLHHDQLTRLSKELEELKKELRPLQSKYKSYKSLPADVNLARVKIQEAKLQLTKLEKQLQTDINLLAF